MINQTRGSPRSRTRRRWRSKSDWDRRRRERNGRGARRPRRRRQTHCGRHCGPRGPGCGPPGRCRLESVLLPSEILLRTGDAGRHRTHRDVRAQPRCLGAQLSARQLLERPHLRCVSVRAREQHTRLSERTRLTLMLAPSFSEKSCVFTITFARPARGLFPQTAYQARRKEEQDNLRTHLLKFMFQINEKNAMEAGRAVV